MTGTVSNVMFRTVTAVAAATVILAACTSGPVIETETTSTTISTSESIASTTTPTLPPVDEVVRGTVDGVVDGETIQAVVGGDQLAVRLIGVDAPGEGECFAAESRAALAELVTGRTVVLTPDGPDIDADGRALRYVTIEDDPPILVNAELVSEGAASPLHGTYASEADFLARGDRAYASGKGMWGTFVCGQTNDDYTPDRPQLRVDAINLPEGADPDDEWFRIVNESYTGVSMNGWTVRDESGDHRLVLKADLGAGKSLQVFSGCGTDGADAVHWCSDDPIWSPAGNTIIIQDPLGNVVDRRPYDLGS